MGIIRLEIDWRVIFESISIIFNNWLTPLNQYIFRKYIMFMFILFKFSKIYYNKKVFFVSPELDKIVKITTFDPHLVPPT